MYIKLYNVTHSGDVVRKDHRMARPVHEEAGSVVPSPAEFEPRRFVIAVYDEGEGHDDKVAEVRASLLEELNLTDGIDIEPVRAAYAFPKALTRDVWILQPAGHFGP